MSAPPQGPAPATARATRSWWRDWRVWLGLAITVVCLWASMRGIPISEVGRAMRRADLWLLVGLSTPAYLAAVFVRGLRWRHLTNPVAPLSRGLLSRGVSIGFMVNNVVPLRIGEVVRAWYVGRESGLSTSALFGTVVLERVIDVVSVLLLALAALAYAGTVGATQGVSADGARASQLLSQGALLLLPAALAPLGVLILLRLAPARVIGVARFVTRPLPDRLGSFVEHTLENFAQGLGALSGGSHLFWIGFHSAIIWVVLSMIPMLAGLWAFGIQIGSPFDTMVVSWIVLGAVGVAVAIPSAPGFFGTYQLAFKTVLEQFGVDPATALALGLLVWFVFWVTLTGLGLVVLRMGGTSLGDFARAPTR